MVVGAGAWCGWRGRGAAALLAGVCGLWTVCVGGCASAPPDARLMRAAAGGDFGAGRLRALENVTDARRDAGDYVLDRLRLGVLALADGEPRAAGRSLDEAYEVLRTQGVNEDKTVASAVLWEGVRTWKGEPFEQAMAFVYVAALHAQEGDWGNVRAAAGNSLFYLRDFGRGRSSADVIREAQRRGDDGLDRGYAAVQSDFALGYLLHGVASRQMGRAEEARDYFRAAVRAQASLQGLAERLESGGDNALFIVDFGLGPEKIATGPDGAIASFRARTESDRAQLAVLVDGRRESFPAAADLNEMSRDLRWNNLEDLRRAKSAIGDVLLLGGAAAGAYGASENKKEVALAGAGAAVAGLLLKAGARADTRHVEVMPQRVYLAPARVGPGQTVTLQVDGRPGSRITLSGLDAARAMQPGSGGLLVRYIRLPVDGRGGDGGGAILYANDATPDPANLGERRLPYILGGNCVRSPTSEALRSYQLAGYLRGMTLGELQELYRAEGIRVYEGFSGGPSPGLHILEGGDSLFVPLPGTAGFSRLFGRVHAPYVPRSEAVRRLAAEIRAGVSAPALLVGDGAGAETPSSALPAGRSPQ
ncbi:MAG: hypothetical protein IBJ11_12105 [Phycisphaerales bacterium]|nr:hypothetical protein [Phycisphaerales bacterium]